MMRLSTGSVIALTLAALAPIVTHRSAVSALAPPLSGGGAFVVDSALDAGPGSLRDAILAADRLSSRARIVIAAPRISVESPLPALINPHGMEIDVRSGAGTIDGSRASKGSVIQINSPASVVHGVHIVNARDIGMLVNAPGVRIDAVTIATSKTAIFVAPAGAGCMVSASTFEQNETGVTADAGARDLGILTSIFRGNTKAGFWAVGGEGGGGKAESDSHEHVRVTDTLFEKNLSGVVLANSPVLFQKVRFIANKETGLLILGGTAKVEDSEFSNTGGTALSINAGTHVAIARSRFVNNDSNAIQVRDSEVSIEGNILTHNGAGMVMIETLDHSVVIRDNEVSRTKTDAVMLIGGSPLLQKNRITDNFGAGIRVLDLASGSAPRKATPRLDGNVVKGNGIDVPPPTVYRMASAR